MTPIYCGLMLSVLTLGKALYSDPEHAMECVWVAVLFTYGTAAATTLRALIG